jgi:hypothetical protein
MISSSVNNCDTIGNQNPMTVLSNKQILTSNTDTNISAMDQGS